MADDDDYAIPNRRAWRQLAAQGRESLPRRLALRDDRRKRFDRLTTDNPEKAEIIAKNTVRDAYVLLEDEPLPRGRDVDRSLPINDAEMLSHIEKAIDARSEAAAS